MPEPIPITDEDVRAAWNDLFQQEVAGHTYPAVPYNPSDSFNVVLFNSLRTVLENDRLRVIERATANA